LHPVALAILLSVTCLSMAATDDPYTEATGFEINNALSGTWWNPDRDGEGFIIDVANAGSIVISFYTYDNTGQQMWLIGTGDVDGSVAVIDFYVTEGGFYGSGFDPELVNRAFWGTGIFTFSECATGVVDIMPGLDFSAEFEDMTTNITRLTVPVNCD
jgi:hypothetical protein